MSRPTFTQVYSVWMIDVCSRMMPIKANQYLRDFMDSGVDPD